LIVSGLVLEQIARLLGGCASIPACLLLDQARSPGDLAYAMSLVKVAPFNISFGLCRLYMPFLRPKRWLGHRRMILRSALSDNIRRPYFKVAKDAYRMWELFQRNSRPKLRVGPFDPTAIRVGIDEDDS
jgi:hypothetical protein